MLWWLLNIKRADADVCTQQVQHTIIIQSYFYYDRKMIEKYEIFQWEIYVSFFQFAHNHEVWIDDMCVCVCASIRQ